METNMDKITRTSNNNAQLNSKALTKIFDDFSIIFARNDICHWKHNDITEAAKRTLSN